VTQSLNSFGVTYSLNYQIPEESLDKMTMPEIAMSLSRTGLTKEIIYANNPTHGYVHRE
jgi:hypothetical protein